MSFFLQNQIFATVLIAILFSWLGIVTYLLVKSYSHYKRLVDVSPDSLDKVMDKVLEQLKIEKKKINFLEDSLENLSLKQKKAISSFNLVRFNPFQEVGGKQSFSSAILNEEGSGIVLTAFHNRDSTRVYAKVIDKGKVKDSELSEEEKLAIKNALRSKNG
jgi:hypothetical protein